MKFFKSAGLAAALAFSVATAALAAGPELNASSTGLAMQGYDPVAYFTLGEATKGSYKISALHNDAQYWFSSEEHKAAFQADPDAFLPEYGGYCAFGAAMGFKFDGDPHHWKIVDGELFLNLSQDIQDRWTKDIPGFIQQADANWTEIEDKEPSSLQQ